MDDQQHSAPVTPQRPKPAERIEVPVGDGYPRLVRTESLPLPMSRTDILHAIDAAVATDGPEALHLHVDPHDLAVFAERVVMSADDEADLRKAHHRFVELARDGMRIAFAVYEERRQAIHRRMREAVLDAEHGVRMSLPSCTEVDARDRLLLAMRSSSCAFNYDDLVAIHDCTLTTIAMASLEALAEAERDLTERLDMDRHIDDHGRRAWAEAMHQAVAHRDVMVRRCRWALDVRVHRQDPTSASTFAWDGLRRIAAMRQTGPLADDSDRLRVLLTWIAADGGRTYHALGIVQLWRAFDPRAAHIAPLMEVGVALVRMLPLVEDADDIELADLRRDWAAWHEEVRREVVRLLYVCGTPHRNRPDRRVVPDWAREAARVTICDDPHTVVDHLAREVEGAGEPGVALYVDRRGDYDVLVADGDPRPIGRTTPRGSDDDGWDDTEAVSRHHHAASAGAISAKPIPALMMPAAPRPEPDPVAMAAPSTAAEAAAARSDSRVVREAHAIASRARREIVGQERAIRAISAAIAEAKAGRKERGVNLLAGPSGSGKTYLVDTIARIAGLAYLSLSVANFVSTGIRGPNVDDIALGMIRVTRGDLNAATHGVVLLDEVDKLTLPTSEYGPTVMGQLLRICDGEPHVIGDTMDRPVHGLTKGSVFHTADLVIVLCGAWSSQRDDAVDAAQSAVGFAVGGRPVKDASKLSLDDLHGVPRELRGRISRYAHLDDHDERSLAEIANRFGHEYLKSASTWDRVDADARFGLVTHALGRGTGARGLRSAIVALRDWLLWHPDRVGPSDRIGIAHVEAALAEADGIAA